MGSRGTGQRRGSATGARLGVGVAAAALAVGIGLAATPLAAAAASEHHGAALQAPVTVQRQRPAQAPGATTPTHLPRLAKPHAVPTRTFTVTTAGDSPLATPTTKSCTDMATHACSLRAAVGAANNLSVPVLIKLGPHTYQVTDATDGTITDTNPAGTTIEGTSTHGTIVSAPGSFAYTVLAVSDGAHSAGASLTLENLTVSGGHGADGGGISASDANVGLVLDGVDVTHGAATYGGGIYCDEASVWATDSSISGNSAVTDGGGLYLDWCSSFFTRATINADATTTATGSMGGGGVYQEYGTARYFDSSISHDSVGSVTESGYGGGVYEYFSDAVLVNTHVDHNTAFDDGEGGGLYVLWSPVEATGSTFNDDRALGTESNGGGLCLSSGGYAELHHSEVEHDATGSTDQYDAGGGVYLYGYESPTTLHVDDHSTISANRTGAIVAYQEYAGADVSIADSTMQGNTNALGGAGGIYAYGYYGGGSIELTNDKVLGNVDGAEDSAGGVYVYTEYAAESVTVTGGTFKGNVGDGKDSMGGIGLYPYYGQSTLTMTGTKVLDNRAPVNGWGGGIGVYDEEDSGVQLTLTRDTIEGNVSGSSSASRAGSGGGIYIYDYAYLDLIDCTVAHNSALGGGATSGIGGGVYDASYLGGTYEGDTITDNKATGPASEGGGMWIYPYYGGGKMVQSTVGGNTAVEGAGLWIYYYQFELMQSTVVDNTAGSAGAEGLGGGVFVYDTRVDLVNSTITGNRAVTGGGKVGAGGGVYNDDGGISLYFATISGNVAPDGAGVYSTGGGYGTLRDSIVSQNHPSPASKAEADCKVLARVDLLVSLGGNVIAQGGCVTARTSTDVVSARPELLPLAANGGPTKTMALMASSPAINAAHGDCLPTDQRGMGRPSAGACDAGAYQLVGKAATKH